MKTFVFLKNGSLYEISEVKETFKCEQYYHVIETKDNKHYEFNHDAVEMVVTTDDDLSEIEDKKEAPVS